MRLTAGRRLAVARDWAAPAIRTLLADRTLHDWAAGQAEHEPLHGRGVSYGVVLPAGRSPGESTEVVVRRTRHGGLLRGFSGELFMTPTRAPLELSNSLRLAAAGVNTPELIAYALYPALLNLVRCDVVTRRLPPGGDFPEVWRRADASARGTLLAALASLLRALSRAGARHADLNLKNVYIAGRGPGSVPYVLDVDRVTFSDRNDAAARNFARLSRSIRKWRAGWGLDFDEQTLERLAALAREKS